MAYSLGMNTHSLCVSVELQVFEYWQTFRKPCPMRAVSRRLGSAAKRAGYPTMHHLCQVPELIRSLHVIHSPLGARALLPLSVWQNATTEERDAWSGVKPELPRKVLIFPIVNTPPVSAVVPAEPNTPLTPEGVNSGVSTKKSSMRVIRGDQEGDTV